MATIAQPSFSQRLFKSTDNSPLIAFRIAFGFLLFYHCFIFLTNGGVYNYLIHPPFTFNYIGLDWLQPLPGNGMYYYVIVMMLLALMVMLGAWYRFSISAFAFLWTVLYLMQKADYNNHYYLILLLCWIMVLMPAERYCSVDVKRDPSIRSTTCPQYCIWLFIAQIAIVYFFAGINKFCPEWLSGKFIAIWFNWFSAHHFFGRIYGYKLFQWTICYGGIAADLLIVPLLLWKRTRNYAFAFSCCFHLFNSYVFHIGIFPYLCIALNLFFLDAAVINRVFFRHKQFLSDDAESISSARKKLVTYGLGIYLFFQLIIPVRSWFFPGDVYWTNEGYRMSWKMMMRTKSGTICFKVTNPVTHLIWKDDPATRFSSMNTMWLATSPDIIWQYAQQLKKEYAAKGFREVQIYAIGQVSINHSVPKPMIDTTVDLASVKWQPFAHAKWITDY